MKNFKLVSSILAVSIFLSVMPLTSFADMVPDTDIYEESSDTADYVAADISLSPVEITDTSITVSWNTIPEAKSYTVKCNDSLLAEDITNNQYDIIGLQPGSEAFVSVNAYDESGALLGYSDEKVFHTNLTVNSNMTLTRDVTFNNLHVVNGTLDLNGHSVVVEADTDIVGSNAKIMVGTGNIHINGSLKLQNETSENSYVSGLEMSNADGNVYIGGDIDFFSRSSSSFKAGKLELCGNINSNSDETGSLF